MKHTYFLATNSRTNLSATQFSSRVGSSFQQVVLKPLNIVVLIAQGQPNEIVIFRFICFSSILRVFMYPQIACLELTYDDNSVAVYKISRTSIDDRNNRCHQRDMTPLQSWQQPIYNLDWSIEVNIHNSMQLLLSGIPTQSWEHDASIIQQEINFLPVLFNTVDKMVNSCEITEIAQQALAYTIFFLNLSGYLLKQFLLPVDQDDSGVVLPGNFDGHELADAHAGSYYDDHTIGIEFEGLGSFEFGVDVGEHNDGHDGECKC